MKVPYDRCDRPQNAGKIDSITSVMLWCRVSGPNGHQPLDTCGHPSRSRTTRRRPFHGRSASLFPSSQLFMKYAFIVACVASACLASAFTLGSVSPAHAQLGGLLARRVSVPEISVAQVRKMQQQHQKQVDSAKKQEMPTPDPAFVLVDARSPEETEVSVIPGAITVKQFEAQQEKFAGTTVIAYCTSGYRSDRYAAKLIDKGIKAKNMKASILGWCAAKLPLETLDRKPTNRVHTYSSQNTVPKIYEAIH
ncbi:rhodanese-like domain-containing protein [Crateriforma conspicua]|nr:rhodanese-like domain-containing protein [Crateriforma conspicua]